MTSQPPSYHGCRFPPRRNNGDANRAQGYRYTRQPLDLATRAFMEPRFGRDFSQVCVHTDATAVESARALGAHAYTVGSNIVLGQGKLAPASSSGRRLIAHELAHVIQQNDMPGL